MEETQSELTKVSTLIKPNTTRKLTTTSAINVDDEMITSRSSDKSLMSDITDFTDKSDSFGNLCLHNSINNHNNTDNKSNSFDNDNPDDINAIKNGKNMNDELIETGNLSENKDDNFQENVKEKSVAIGKKQIENPTVIIEADPSEPISHSSDEDISQLLLKQKISANVENKEFIQNIEHNEIKQENIDEVEESDEEKNEDTSKMQQEPETYEAELNEIEENDTVKPEFMDKIEKKQDDVNLEVTSEEKEYNSLESQEASIDELIIESLESQEIERKEKEEKELAIALENRMKIVNQIRSIVYENQVLARTNKASTKRIYEYIKRRKLDVGKDITKQQSVIADNAEKYAKLMQSVVYFQKELFKSEQDIVDKLNEIKNAELSIEKELLDNNSDFFKFRETLVTKAENSRTGKKLKVEYIENYFVQEERKNEQIHQMRLNNIKLENQAKKLNNKILEKENIGSDLSIIDVEQLKIENQQHNEKYEEKNEMIRKLQERISTNIHRIAHIKEKLCFTNIEIKVQQEVSKEDIITFNKSRMELTNSKRIKDKYLRSNLKIVNSCGMVGKPDVMRDYERSVEKLDNQKQRVAQKINQFNLMNSKIKITQRNIHNCSVIS